MGTHLQCLVYARDCPVAGLALSSAARHLGPRDGFIGWSPEACRRHLHRIRLSAAQLASLVAELRTHLPAPLFERVHTAGRIRPVASQPARGFRMICPL
jgi:hypothetical protein